MAKLRFSIHPLFFVFGVYFALTGKIFVFLTYTCVAVIHEIGHASAAAGLGYRLNRVVLMPYGAVISGDIKGLNFKDEIYVALAGPLINLECAVIFAATWWVFPESYAYTDTAMLACVSIALVNLLPCRPLDGGRVLHALLNLYASRKVADVTLKITGIVFSCVLAGLFVFSCFYTVNLSLLFFALFAIFGTFFTGRDKGYVKIYENAYERAMKCGAEVRRIAVCENTSVKRILALTDSEVLTEIAVFSADGRLLKVITPKEVCDLLAGDTLYSQIGDLLATEK